MKRELVKCPVCNGEGVRHDEANEIPWDDLPDCHKCKGTGYIKQPTQNLKENK